MSILKSRQVGTMMNHISSLLKIGALVIVVIFGCEREFIPDTVDLPNEIVVEGYVEAGEGTLPTYVLLSRSVPFFSKVDVDGLNEIYISDAVVSVVHNDKTFVLQKLCFDQLTDEMKLFLSNEIGLDSVIPNLDICVFIDLLDEIKPEEGEEYDLIVDVEGQVLHSSTTIPTMVPLDSIWFAAPFGIQNKNYSELNVRITDPAELDSYFRYAIGVNEIPIRVGSHSVFDDVVFNGQSFRFKLQKPENVGEDFDIATYGLFEKGDTVRLKWSTIDQAHFDFWRTLEYNKENQGPFSSYTRVATNIEGGLGIWGGYNSRIYELMVPFK